MTLSLNAISLAVPEQAAAAAFYTSVLSPVAAENGDAIQLDMHGAGQVTLQDGDSLAAEAGVSPATSGFRGYIVSYILDQPGEVEAVLDAAVRGGARILKPPKKGFFGGFTASFQAPDGSIWKLASERKKDSAPAGNPPKPHETAALLGVRDPKASKTFYTALGMKTDRDYGNKYIDFVPATGGCRLGLMQRPELAKDVGIGNDGDGFKAVVLNCTAGSREEADSLLQAAASGGGGRITAAAVASADGSYTRHFADPDGFLWKVTSH